MIRNVKKGYILILTIYLILFSCSNTDNSTSNNYIKSESETTINKNIDYNNYNIINISPAEVIIPKNQTSAQSLSIIVTDGYGHLVVFDGGRVEDADSLCDIIKDNGGVVTSWFITHIHDDHIGALYEILNKKRTDIEIKELVYDFADFNWYYSKMGNDAGIYYLFENAIKEYNEFISSLNKSKIKINKSDKEYIYINENKKSNDLNDSFPDNKSDLSKSESVERTLEVHKLNDIYLLDRDPINNTSIVYLVNINNKQSMVVFGDLGYDGGEKLFNDIDNKNENIKKMFYNSNVIVLSHHGQNGIAPELYKKFNPKVVIWSTSKDIYENVNGKYYTNDTKRVLSEINSIECQIISYEETAVIR